MTPARRQLGEFTWIWLATLALFVASALVAPATLERSSLQLLLPFAGVLAIAAAGQSLVIRQRGIDLSVPGAMSLAGVIVASVAADGASVPIAIAVAVAVAGCVGLLVGLVVTRLGVTPLVTTLAVNALLLGAIQTVSDGVPAGAPTSLSRFALGSVAGIPNVAIVAVLAVAAIELVVRRTAAGRRFVAVGENPQAARVAGVGIARVEVLTYGIAAVAYAVSGILLTGYVETAVPNAGDAYLLPVIAAVVVGGTPFTGGRGSVVATAAAALFLSQLLQVVLAMGAPTSVQLLVQSAAIGVATGVRHLPWHRLRGRVRVEGYAAR